ncbi:MAG: hypothetical protein P4M14_12590 [Gammaproteobacteria bacterium]|nr:hypothetical protein [Gammaproteobacteria bacterium]
MSSSSKPLDLTPLEKKHTQIIDLTRYFDEHDQDKLKQLKKLCEELIALIQTEETSQPARPKDAFELIDLLKLASNNTIQFITHLTAGNDAFQKLSAVKKIDAKQMPDFFKTIENAIASYDVCIGLASQHNWLASRTLSTLKKYSLEKNIELELLTRSCLMRYYAEATKRDAVNHIKNYLQQIIDCNTSILKYIQKLDSKKFASEKDETEKLQRDCHRELHKLPNNFPEAIQPTPKKPFFNPPKPITETLDSLDELVEKMNLAGPVAKKNESKKRK